MDSVRARLIGSGLHLDSRVSHSPAIQILEKTRLGRTTMNFIYGIMDSVRNWFVARKPGEQFDKGYQIGRSAGKHEALLIAIHELQQSGYLDFQDDRFKLGFNQAIFVLEKKANE